MARTVVILAAGNGTRLSRWKRAVPKPLIRLCGMSLIERVIRTAGRAGHTDFVVVTGYRGEEIRATLGDGKAFGVRITYVDNPEWERGNGTSALAAQEQVSGKEFVLLMADHMIDKAVFERLSKISLGADDLVLMTDRRIKQIFDLPDATKVRLDGDRIVEIGKEIPTYDAADTGVFICSGALFPMLREASGAQKSLGLSDGVRKLAERGKARSEDVGAGWWQDVDTRAAYRHAEKLLLAAQRKPTDTFIARTINRPISLFLSRFLCRTSVRPDVISFVSMAIGMFSPVFLIQGEYWGFVLGALFYHFSSVLDGCDGEVARLKFLESNHGEWIDTISDCVSHFLFALGLVVGLYVQSADPMILWLGALGVAGIVALLWVMFQYLRKVAKRGTLLAFERDFTRGVAADRDFATWLARALKPLLRRPTFAFLFLLLAVLGQVHWVLYLIAFGPNIATLLIYITFRRRLREAAMELAR